jgi:mannose-6-phosphate isomerase-like protein (cupin superfamily)
MQAQFDDRLPALAGLNASAAGGDAHWFTDNRMTILVRAHETGGAFGAVEGVGRPGSSPPLHVHSREDEVFVLLSGRLLVRCGDDTFRAEPGSATFLPRGVPHTFLVDGDEPARLISLSLPGGFEEFFAAAGRPAERDGLPPQEPPDVPRLQQVGAQFGLQFVGPPLRPGDQPA